MASIGYRDTDVITQAVGATAVVENRFVKVGAAAGLVIPATAQTDAIIGTSRVGGATGEAIGVVTKSKVGTFIVEASAAIAAGDRITATTAGKAVTNASGQAVALSAASGDTILVEALWI